MKNNVLAIITIVTGILLASCEKEIEFNGEQTDSKLVINSLIEPGQPIKANISKSIFFLDNEANTEAPDDLVAMLYVNGDLLGTMTPHYDTIISYEVWNPNDPNLGRVQKVYTYDYCPVAGDIIKITASANGFDDVEGETSPLPQPVEWSLGDFKITHLNTDFYIDEEDTIVTVYGSFELTVNLRDLSSNKSDFYRLLARFNNYDDYMNDDRFYITPTYDDPVFGSVVSENDIFDLDLSTTPEGVFSDVLFDGKTYQIKLPLNIYGTYKNHPNADVYRLPVVMQHLSKEYYYYLNTCDQGDEYNAFFAEPIQTYTNVEGGFGIVGGRSVDTLWFALPVER